MRPRALAAIALLLLAGTPLTAAQSPVPTSATWAVGDWDLRFVELTRMEVVGNLSVHKMQLDGEVTTADEFRTEHDEAKQDGRGQAYIDDAEATVADQVRSTLRNAYPEAGIDPIQVQIDRDSLPDASGTNAYHPPIVFAVRTTVNLSLASLGVEGADDEQLVEDALAMGAEADLEMPFTARPGRNHTYRVHLPDQVRLTEPPGAPARGTSFGLEVTLVNWRGSAPPKRTIPLTVTGANATIHDSSRESALVRVDLHQVQDASLLGGQVTLAVRVDVVAELHVLEVPADMQRDLPDEVELAFISADAFRLARDRGHLNDTHLQQALERFDENVTRALRSEFGDDVEPSVRLAPATLEAGYDPDALDASPPIRATAEATSEMQIRFFGREATGLVVHSIGRSVELSSFPGWPTTYEIWLPEGLTVAGVQPPSPDVSTRTETRDGREVLVADLPETAGQDAGTMQMTVGVNLGFVLTHFPLALVGAILFVALLVGVVAWGVAGRDRSEPDRKA